MTQSVASRTTRVAALRATVDRALDRSAALSTIVVPPFAAAGAAELLGERAAGSFAGLRTCVQAIQLALLHPALWLGGE
ncbi:MAG: hypothetical protein JOZ41_04235 [Chloroflexi bacterium]|nr:hypothetical protein [Chloroflexota bacterium]